MRITKRTIYEIEIEPAGKAYSIEFIREKSCPGFSHRVIISRNNVLVKKDWLSKDSRPNMKSAVFFAEKHL